MQNPNTAAVKLVEIQVQKHCLNRSLHQGAMLIPRPPIDKSKNQEFHIKSIIIKNPDGKKNLTWILIMKTS